jgi:RNA polymerase sigma-70 factor (ECF subfamily)
MLGPDFAEVLQDAARGHETAFARLWRDNHPPLLRFLRVLTSDSAEDVASEVWLEIARGLTRFRGGEPEFRRWLFTTARRRAIDLHRYSARHPATVTSDLMDLERPAPGDAATAALEQMSTEAALELIATLPPEQAEIVALRVIAGLDVAYVAEIVGKRPGTVRVASHRALRTLAATLAAAADQEATR